MKKVLFCLVLVSAAVLAAGITPQPTQTKLTVESAWAGDGKSVQTAYHPKAIDDYACNSFRDLTGNKPTQSTGTIIEITCDSAVAAQIQLNSAYPTLAVQDATVAVGQ